MDSSLDAQGKGSSVAEGGPRRLPLLETVPSLLELLDSRGISHLRRTARFDESLAREARVAELSAAVLELLCVTAFPFTHAAYVLGLNGPYYSYDTFADNHYGIPKALPPMLCELFRLMVPGKAFTTIRIQKLASAANFGGQHRTLAFSLAGPPNDDLDGQAAEIDLQADSDSPSTSPVGNDSAPQNFGDLPTCTNDEDDESQGYAVFLSAGCLGGRGEVCEDIRAGAWRVLGKPLRSAKWVPFLRHAWLQWHWPQVGDLFTITVTCEPPLHRNQLTLRERRRMTKMGFCLPGQGKAEEVDSNDEKETDSRHQSDGPGASASLRTPVRRSLAALEAARRILGFDAEATVTAKEVEEAFRRAVRAVHPDREQQVHQDEGGSESVAESAEDGISSRMRGWAVAQVTWARKVLREAAQLGVAAPTEETPEPAGPLLMLAEPPRED